LSTRQMGARLNQQVDAICLRAQGLIIRFKGIGNHYE
jgi:hypothetical protein